MRVYIITVTYNDFSNLQRTIESVRLNKKHFHTFCIIDGASKDKTRLLIESNLDVIDNWISEPDKGIYDAMNKALRFDVNDDDFIIWLNAGDLLTDWNGYPIEEFDGYDCLFAPVLAKVSDKYKERLIFPDIRIPYNERNFFPTSTFMHQGFLIKKSVFSQIGYDLKIGIQAENLLMSTCIKHFKFGIFNYPTAVFYLDGVSNRYFKQILRSYISVARRLNFNIPKLVFHQLPFFTKTAVKIVLPYKLFNLIRKK